MRNIVIMNDYISHLKSKYNKVNHISKYVLLVGRSLFDLVSYSILHKNFRFSLVPSSCLKRLIMESIGLF